MTRTKPGRTGSTPSSVKHKYRTLMKIGYEPSHEKEEKLVQEAGYIKDHELSQKKDKVYYHPQEKKAYVVYKGTNPTDLRDVATDMALAFGFEKYTPRFRQAKRLARRAEEKYGKNQVEAVGHSLGGSLATESGLSTRVTLNKGVGLGGIGRQLRRGQIDYRSPNDVVSLLSSFSSYKNKSGDAGGTHAEKVGGNRLPWNSHGLDVLQ